MISASDLDEAESPQVLDFLLASCSQILQFSDMKRHFQLPIVYYSS